MVVGARRAEALAEIVRKCLVAGAPAAIAVPTDVTVEADVMKLAASALAKVGTIDAWINNAGVTYYAHLDEGLCEDHRGVIDLYEPNGMHATHGTRPPLVGLARFGPRFVRALRS